MSGWRNSTIAGRVGEVVGEMAAGVAGAPPGRRLGLVAELGRLGQRRLVAVERGAVPPGHGRLGGRVGDARGTAGAARCRRSAPAGRPAGTTAAPRRSTGSSVNRRIARVVIIASIVSLGHGHVVAHRCDHRPAKRASAGDEGVDRLGVVGRQEARDLQRRRHVEAGQQRLLDLGVDGLLRALHGERRAARPGDGPRPCARRARRLGRADLGGDPEPAASAAVSGSPSSRWRLAASGPSSSGQIAAPPSPATRPTLHVRVDDDRPLGHHDDVAEQGDRGGRGRRPSRSARTRSAPRRRAGPR